MNLYPRELGLYKSRCFLTEFCCMVLTRCTYSDEHESWSAHLKGLRLNARPKRDIMKGWYNMLWLYGPKNLSRTTDKLPAVSGIASLYAEKIDEEYLAGLWRGQLIEGLMWQSLSFRRVHEYRAPSWSWTSGDGIPATGQIVDFTDMAEILETKVTLKSTNPFVEVSDGYIKIRAPMEQLYSMLEDWDPEAPGHYKYSNNITVRTKNDDQKGVYARFDFAFTAEDAPQEVKKIAKSLEGVDIFALFILKSRSWNADAADNEGTYHALIVRKVDGTDAYQRLGFLLGDKEVIGREPEKRRCRNVSYDHTCLGGLLPARVGVRPGSMRQRHPRAPTASMLQLPYDYRQIRIVSDLAMSKMNSWCEIYSKCT
ncbi:hypothetical protein BU23DRAFT_570036 [Bimuria novae-zelandiae CBS 107.79]|uniref:Heterokaryon incompatibility domain-containing protein n=1 Tax=Bimuria novae-zelandiae CBS 107.79 TaxID=1447943 RepID=A0A6A5V2C1_9PLEO|nr:hypothetical protein BU23DRAFT_570036 [Bimuria novae-zelandiae CBS 107.79]